MTRHVLLGILACALSLPCLSGEALQLTATPCSRCDGKGFTEIWPLCPACQERYQQLYLTAKRELTKGGREREDVAAVAKLARSRLPTCKTCNAAERTRKPCPECGGRGMLYFLPDGRKLPPGVAPENEKSRAAKHRQEADDLRAEIRRLEEQLAAARAKLAALDGRAVEAPAAAKPSEQLPHNPPVETPVEFNPRERVSVPRENF